MPRGVYIRTKPVKSPMLGKKHSIKTKRKMSESAKGKNNSNWKGGISYNWRKKAGLISTKRGRKRKTELELLEKKRFRNQRYKARKIKAEGSHSFEEWLSLKAYYKNMCLCCKRQEPEIKLTEDHIIPLSMGGSDYIENIQPLCTSCNTRKFTKNINYRRFYTPKGGEERLVLMTN